MAPPQPCKGCKSAGLCPAAGLVNQLAVDEWLVDNSFECSDFTPDYYKGLEGCYA